MQKKKFTKSKGLNKSVFMLVPKLEGMVYMEHQWLQLNSMKTLKPTVQVGDPFENTFKACLELMKDEEFRRHMK